LYIFFQKKKNPWAKDTLKLSPLSGLNLAHTKRAWIRAQRPLLDIHTHTHTHTHTRPLLAYATPPSRDGQRDSTHDNTHELPRLADPRVSAHMETARKDTGGGHRDCGEGWKDGDGLGALRSDGFGDLPSAGGSPEVWRRCVGDATMC